MVLESCGYRTCENLDQNYTYVNLHSEGVIYKPTNEFLKKKIKVGIKLLKFRGNSFDTGQNYMKNLRKHSKNIFLGRTFLGIRFLNRTIKESKTNINANKNEKKK